MNRMAFGYEVSNCSEKNGKVDLGTLGKVVGGVRSSTIVDVVEEKIGSWEVENGSWYDEETDEYVVCSQWYIISQQGAELLKKYTDYLVLYNYQLDMYVWGIECANVEWKDVLTDIDL